MAWRSPWVPKRETKSSVTLGVNDELSTFLKFGARGASTPQAALSLYENSTAVSIPINMIVEPFQILEPILLIDGKLVEGHPVISLLNQPCPYFDKITFMEFIAREYLITGEAWIAALGTATREPLELQPITARSTTLVMGPGGYPKAYDVAGNVLSGAYKPKPVGKGIRYYDGSLREMKLIRNYSTKDNSLLRGQSKLVQASREARQHILGSDHNISILEQGGRMSLIFHLKEDLDPDEFEEQRDRILKRYGGADKAGSIGVTSGADMDIKDIGSSNKDMDYVDLQKMAQKAVALQYRVPLPLVSDERQTLNNYMEGKLALYDDAVTPLSKKLFGGLGDFLLPRYGLDPTTAVITYDPDDVSALVKRRNDELKTRAEIGIETTNELRGIMNREPLDAGGDVIYQSSSMIPLGTDLFTDDNDIDVIEDLN